MPLPESVAGFGCEHESRTTGCPLSRLKVKKASGCVLELQCFFLALVASAVFRTVAHGVAATDAACPIW